MLTNTAAADTADEPLPDVEPWQSSHPAFVVIVGKSNMGKSIMCMEADPTGLGLTRPGGLQSIGTFLQIEVNELSVKNFDDVLSILPTVADAGYESVTIDDLSLLADATEQGITKSKNKYAKFDTLNGYMVRLREGARQAGLHVFINAHERPPGTDASNRKREGGPRLPSWNMADALVNEASLVLHAVLDPSVKADWKVVLRREDNKQWQGKDRHNVTAAVNPPNLRVLLEAAGYSMPRAPGLEWQNDVAADVRRRMTEGSTREQITEAVFYKLIRAGLHPSHVAWAIRDGVHGHQLAVSTQDRWKKNLGF